ncbi:VTT domain-containing protein [Variovorax sp. J22P168]|uniref:DedA family protein n=1 Tax=Variovorax jilinensis TaxID=3053513 RepID=UPI002578C409|nr:VTT domain-containing protein [Variovorax sp. J22P168]MDM0012816.1 VTT domain-containing protein [Variovorax sp. J22P168]
MHLSELLAQYGYIVVFLAGLFEGETILMLGAFAVHQGYLSLLPLIAVGAASAFATDQFYFHLSRRKGRELLARRTQLKAHIDRVNGFVSRHPVATIFLMRFAWGLRIALPATLGMGPMRATVYAALDVLAALLWATVIAVFGLKLSGLLHAWIGQLRPHEHTLILGALVITLIVGLVAQWRARR